VPGVIARWVGFLLDGRPGACYHWAVITGHGASRSVPVQLRWGGVMRELLGPGGSRRRRSRVGTVLVLAAAAVVSVGAAVGGGVAQAAAPDSGVRAGTGTAVDAVSAGPVISWDRSRTVLARTGSWPRLLLGAGAAAGRRDLLFYTTFNPGEPATVTVVESTDLGRSGRVISTIPSPAGTIQEQAFPLRLADGTILIATRYRTTALTAYSLPVFASHDGGRSWTRVGSIDDNPHAAGRGDRGLWEPFLAALPNGCVAGMYANELHADAPPAGGPTYSQTVSERVSCDGGRTWGTEHLVAASPGDARPGMPGLARLADGRFIATFEACVRDDCNAHYKISRDEVTWFPGLGTQIPDQNVGPYVTALSDGRVAVTSACTNEVSVSADNASTWHTQPTRPFNLTCADGAYPYTWPALYQIGRREVADVVNVGPGTLQIRYGHW